MRITSFGHSCLLVETTGARVLIDPGSFSPGWESVEGLDAVLITHQHGDHVDQSRLPQLVEANPGVRVLAEPEVALALVMLDTEVSSFAAGDRAAIGDLSVEGVGGTHATIHVDIPLVGNTGLVLSDGATRLFHPGDSLAAVPDDVDVLAVPLMAPWMALKEMIDFTRAVSPRIAVPIHDAMLQPSARGLFLMQLGNLGQADDVHDLAEAPLDV